MCRRCRDDGVAVVDRRCRLVAHILKTHVSLDNVPFYCRLCLFRAMDRRSLFNHLTKYKRHTRLANELGIIDHSGYLGESARPAAIGEEDMVLLNQEEASQYNGQSTAPEDPLNDWDEVIATSSTPVQRPVLMPIPLLNAPAMMTASKLPAPAVMTANMVPRPA